MPMKLTFSTVRGSAVPYECGEAYTTIFKRGDDLRSIKKWKKIFVVKYLVTLIFISKSRDNN